MSFSGTGVHYKRWNLRASHDAKRVEAHTQRQSALASTCGAHVLNLMALCNGCTQPLQLDENTTLRAGVSDDVLL